MELNKLIKIFVIDDDPLFGEMIKMKLEEASHFDVSIFTSGEQFFENIHLNPDIVVVDYYLPKQNGIDILREINRINKDIATIIVSGQQSVEVVVEAYNLGAKNYIVKNEKAIVELNNCVKNLSQNVSLRKEVDSLKDQIIENNKYSGIVGESPSLMKIFNLMRKIEKTDALALITGESGTGKELIAKAIHYHSNRKRKPFVAINIAAFPEDLIESELFGHEKGAFTGASSRRIGKFEEANHGTIFLDEIGEIDMNIQKKLLRVLQEKTITKLGGNKEIKLDVRILAATNKSLGQLVKENKFREDLYYRLQGFLIHLPTLRERGHDSVLIAKYYLEEFCKKNKMAHKTFDSHVIKEFLQYQWPGNVRELKSVVERACLISEEDKITVDDLIFSEAIS